MNVLQRVKASHSYGFVMIFVITTIVLAIAIPEASRWRAAILVCQAITALLACWTSDAPKRIFRLVVAFSTVGVLGAIGIGIFGEAGSVLGRTANVLGVLLVAGVIMRGIAVDIRSQGVRGRAVAGALTIYLLFGTLFGFVYGLEQSLSGTPVLVATNSTLESDVSTSANMYFSFVTLTTVGYGDLTPAGGASRATAIFEAAFGQLYLVGIVATLAGALGKGKTAVEQELVGEPASAPQSSSEG